MRITIVSSSLSHGGAERAVVLQARGFLQHRHHVSVVTLGPSRDDFYELPGEAERIALNLVGDSPSLLQALSNNLGRLKALRRAIISTRPDVVISHIDQMNVLTKLALAQARYPVIVTEHCDPNCYDRGAKWRRLRRLTYPRVAKVVSVSHGIDRFFDWLPPAQRIVIHNPVVVEPDQEPAELPIELAPGQQLITAMGRLTRQKGFDLLLQAFRKVADRNPDWQLVIIGEGELRNDLERQRDDLELRSRVFLPGTIASPFPLLRRSQLFVMASRFEGFPYALLEAMACGLPVIYTDCPSGPNEIIRHQVDGFLTPNGDIAALAVAMDRLMSSEEERNRLALRAREVTERFSLERIMQRWEELLSQVVSESRRN